MTNKERENFKNEIAYRDVMTRKLGKTAKMLFVFFLLFLAVTLWGFGVFNDNFLVGMEGARSVIKWICLIGAIGTGVFALLFFLSFRNSKKYVLNMIDELQGRKTK